MADADIAQTGLARAMARFPEAAAALRSLALSDPEFREICEEYALAQQSLAGFEARPDAAKRPEIGEYRAVDRRARERDRPISEGGRADDTRAEGARQTKSGVTGGLGRAAEEGHASHNRAHR